jgi:hypothetical protein
MARLPVPGGDDGAWGTVLNEFLQVSHNGDGTLRGGVATLARVVAAADAPLAVRGLADHVCDGVDDQVQINQAIDALAPFGGRVQLTQGTFQCSGPVRLRRRTTLAGEGRSTILAAHGSWAAFDGTAPGAVIESIDDTIDKTHVSMLAIDGRRYQGADVKGVYYNITTRDFFDESSDAAHYFADLYIFETRRHGFHIAGSNMRAACASRVRIYNVGAEGQVVAHGFFVEAVDSFFAQCESGSSSGSGFVVAGANNRFTNCKSWYSDLSGWQILIPRNQFSACESQDNQEHGFYLTTGPNSLVGCHADSNSWNSAAPTSGYDGFHIPWGSRIQLIGCSAYDKNEGGRGLFQRYGFYLGSAAQHCQVIGTAKDNASGGTGGGGVPGNNVVMVNGQ